MSNHVNITWITYYRNTYKTLLKWDNCSRDFNKQYTQQNSALFFVSRKQGSQSRCWSRLPDISCAPIYSENVLLSINVKHKFVVILQSRNTVLEGWSVWNVVLVLVAMMHCSVVVNVIRLQCMSFFTIGQFSRKIIKNYWTACY